MSEDKIMECSQEMFGQMQNLLLSFRIAQLPLSNDERTQVVLTALASFMSLVVHELFHPEVHADVMKAIIEHAMRYKPVMRADLQEASETVN